MSGVSVGVWSVSILSFPETTCRRSDLATYTDNACEQSLLIINRAARILCSRSHAERHREAGLLLEGLEPNSRGPEGG